MTSIQAFERTDIHSRYLHIIYIYVCVQMININIVPPRFQYEVTSLQQSILVDA